ncbi:hypothetical protein [Chryseobacterium timonianum]|nr:hypothetical protein [Chryseobacterium timonianum]
MKRKVLRGMMEYFKEAKHGDFVAEEALWLNVCLIRINFIDSTLCSL